ncbi:MAG: hypothetical protein H6937_00775 [Burkholderiales bacterium]|nr:hypothetical protein [Burkholderiales bacterium]MDR4518343.1 hypothetical protein [Nitrosomonas sp.]
MFMRITTILIGICALVISQSGLANDVKLRGKPSNTEFSGKDASQKATVEKSFSDNDAIYGIVAGEDTNDPCYLKVNFRDVTTGATSSKSYNECDGHKEGDLETLTLPDGAFATGVRVCLNNDEDKIKGIQLIGNYGGCLLGAESVSVVPPDCSPPIKISGHDYQLCNTDQPAYITRSCNTEIGPSFERANCVGTNTGKPDSDWKKTVKCPPGQVATGMKLNTRAGSGNRRMYNGISLVCYEISE